MTIEEKIALSGNIEIIHWGSINSKPEWLALRRKVSGSGETYTRLGASSIGTITGSNKWTSRRRLALEMAGLYAKDWVNTLVVQGGLMEGVNAKYWEGWVQGDKERSLYNTRDGIRLRKITEARFFLLNKKYPHLFASLDAIPDEIDYVNPFTGEISDPLLPHEMKYVSKESYRSWNGVISQAYREQCTLQNLVSETNETIFLPLLQDGDYKPVEIPFDKELALHLAEVSAIWCADITKIKILKLQADMSKDLFEKEDLLYQIEDLLPQDDTNDDSVDLANELHQGAIDTDSLLKKVGEYSEENGLMENFANLKAQEKEIGEHINLVQATLINKCKGFEGFESPEFKATIRGNNSTKSKYFRVVPKKKD